MTPRLSPSARAVLIQRDADIAARRVERDAARTQTPDRVTPGEGEARSGHTT